MDQREALEVGFARGRVHTVGRRSSKAVEHLQRLGDDVILQARLQELLDRDDAVLIQV